VIPISDIYDKDINFLLGSGASHGLFPTLKLGMRKNDGRPWSLEELATQFNIESDPRYVALFMHYYSTCIQPAQEFDIAAAHNPSGHAAIANYRQFLETVLITLQHRAPMERRCNLFTTNYDGCLELIADEIFKTGGYDFVINDGTRGFRHKVLEARNFNTFLCHSGIFDRHLSGIPQINLIHLHGSVYWRKSGDFITADYTLDPKSGLLDAQSHLALQAFSDALADPNTQPGQLEAPDFTQEQREAFWKEYQRIPIVNPTKWKFHETVYEEHYYQMLRLLSYELERQNAVLITFGFSFADEHILNLVKRSLSNPHLQVFICCYDQGELERLSAQFRFHKNVQCIGLPNSQLLDFSAFNSQVLSHKPAARANSIAAPATSGAPVVAVA
jgi:hypothetical protein